tara:strand:- start:474 stop:1049 length:576 start_codon:yes stop_codon:yes gene_type:complete
MKNKELIIFDFDYTLAKTIESIWVWSPRGTRLYKNKPYIPVHPSMLSKQKIGDDEEINDDSFKEFYSLNVNRSKPIKLTNFLLNYYLGMPEEYDVYILTARPESAKEDIMCFLKDHVADLTNLNFIGLQNSKPQAKIDIIKNILLENNYLHMSLYEDNDYMINNISQQIEIPVSKYHIKSLGKELRISCYE